MDNIKKIRLIYNMTQENLTESMPNQPQQQYPYSIYIRKRNIAFKIKLEYMIYKTKDKQK